MATGIDFSKTIAGGSEELFDVCCSPCSEDGISTEAEKYCIDCEMYYCGKCLKYHNRIPSSRGHRIVDKSEPEEGRTRTALPTERCVTHSGKLNDMFCGDHDVVCCSACCAVFHRTCAKVEYLPDVARGIKESQEFNDVKGMLHTILCELQGEQTKRKDNLSSLQNESENILTEINQYEENLIIRIRALAQTTRETLNSILFEGQKILEDDIKTITSAITTISLNEENISSGNEAEIFAKIKCGKFAIKSCKVLLRELSERSSRKMLRFVANDKLKSDVNQTECIGTVCILQDEKNKDSKIKAEEQTTELLKSELKEKIKEEEKSDAKVRETKKNDQEVIQYTATLFGKYKVNENDCKVTAACILDNNSLMIFDNSNNVLKRLSMNDFQIIDQLKLEGFSYSICSVGTEEVAVALRYINKIQLVSVGRTMTLTRSFSTHHRCFGMAFNEVSGEFYVSNFSNQVIVYDKNGKLMKAYDKDGERRSMFFLTANMAWSEDKTVLYVTDWDKGLIALSMSGDLLWKFTDSELKNANGVCVLPGDVTLVSGVNSHNVIQVDKRGKKIGTLLGAGDNVIKPWALAYDRNRSRLMVGHNSNEIHVYNLATK